MKTKIALFWLVELDKWKPTIMFRFHFTFDALNITRPSVVYYVISRERLENVPIRLACLGVKQYFYI